MVLNFTRCKRVAKYEVRGAWSLVRLCEQCRRDHARAADEHFPGVTWWVKRLVPEKALTVVWALVAFGLGLVLGGCGSVDQAAQLDASGAGGAGAYASSSGGGGAAGAAGDGSPAGGAAGGGQGGAIPLGADAGGTAGREVDAGAAWPTCPRVGGLLIEYAAHCWACEGQTDAGVVSGSVAGPCQIEAGNARGLGLNQGPDYCAAKAAACP